MAPAAARVRSRVFIKPGKGSIVVNDKPVDEFFSVKPAVWWCASRCN
jgi:ribosomal protein S9